MKALRICVLLVLGACTFDETMTNYGASNTRWALTEVNGAAFLANVIISFPAPGKISGKGPCNQFNATITAPYPWFNIDNISSTKMACPDLNLEKVFLKTLNEMTLSEVSGNTLILSNDTGNAMQFTAVE